MIEIQPTNFEPPRIESTGGIWAHDRKCDWKPSGNCIQNHLEFMSSFGHFQTDFLQNWSENMSKTSPNHAQVVPNSVELVRLFRVVRPLTFDFLRFANWPQKPSNMFLMSLQICQLFQTVGRFVLTRCLVYIWICILVYYIYIYIYMCAQNIRSCNLSVYLGSLTLLFQHVTPILNHFATWNALRVLKSSRIQS